MEATIVSYAEGSVKTVLGKLGSLLAQEVVKLWGVRDDIQELKDELESMNSFMRKNARKENLDEQVKTWIKHVREMAYDMEDCIDEFMHRVGGPIEGGCLQYPRRGIRLVRTLKSRIEIISKIKSLKTRIRSVSERHSRYAHLVSPPEIGESAISYVDRRHSSLFPKEGEVVGIEDRTKMVVQLLMDKDNAPDLRVISIVGYGGLGKTTLAMTAYESPKVKNDHFQCRAQISVSQKFNTNALLRDIFKQVFPSPDQKIGAAGETSSNNPLENIEKWSEYELVKKLKDYLEKKIYIVIIDDIWSESAWDNIKYVFPNSKNGSRIIVTTRIDSVAHSCSSSTHDYIYQIKPLSEKDSQYLFYKKVFGGSNACPPELEKVSKDILKKCGGMPLAIVSIAGLLSVKTNKSEYEWKKIYESLGSELETNPSLEGIRKILNLSYNDLPYHLKTCFLYMSIFPEDYKIRRTRLVRRWIAEGFVSGKRGLNEEQVAESYFEEFVNRNLILVVDSSIDGRVKNCRVHDMILELLVSKSVEDNFISLVGDRYTTVTGDKIRRLSVHNSEQNFMNIGLYHARSLSLFIDQIKSFSLSSFGVLRVLDLENSGINNNHLNSLGNLVLLKYLSLRNNRYVTKLPAQIEKLKHLETLDIRGTNIEKISKGVFKLQNLKHLVLLYGSISSLKLGNMRNLETLNFVRLKKGISKSLENLKCLRRLGLYISKDSKEELLNIELSQNLFSLYLDYSGGYLPKCIDSLQYLVKVKLVSLILTDMDMQKLGSLPRLLSLKLYYIESPSNQENKIFFRGQLFPKLKLLKMNPNYSEFGEIIFEEATSPNLEQFQVYVDYFQHNQPEKYITGIHHLLKLKEVAVWPESLRDAVKMNAVAHPNPPNVIEWE